ncbi:MAG: hypothetical protein ACI9PP_000560 [Halobacteriales archaeon]|jgi:hypothetical protein
MTCGSHPESTTGIGIGWLERETKRFLESS